MMRQLPLSAAPRPPACLGRLVAALRSVFAGRQHRVNSAWHYHSHHELRPGLPCGQQRSPLAAAARSMLCHKAASVVRGLMSKPRAPRTSVHAAPCCGIRTIFWSADQGSVRREPYRSAKKSSRGCRPRASAQPIHEPVIMPWSGVFGTCSTWDGAPNRTAWNLLDHPCARRVARAALVRETQRETCHHRYTRRCS